MIAYKSKIEIEEQYISSEKKNILVGLFNLFGIRFKWTEITDKMICNYCKNDMEDSKDKGSKFRYYCKKCRCYKSCETLKCL